ncbi:sensor histidine kinase [Gracilibacillus thailandensis]|uniref:histidine kinase n=1 Tax=Gracilibacillus thailandensis TaxID=563735 RepID=A0A6N7QYE2_9BACI|nr:HAMP domain-containing sensor histidine kinase [Gracilibacillus thailandensis]MRI65895.1 sensor histidine kinase [Gracilibacillus thailandensis]
MKLSTKYILVILLSILIFPISFFGVNFLYYLLLNFLSTIYNEESISEQDLEQLWEEKIASLAYQETNYIINELEDFDIESDEIIYWIGDDGEIIFSTEHREASLSVTDTIEFVQNKQNEDYYSNFTYLEGEEKSGYIILQIPNQNIGTDREILDQKYSSFWYLFLFTIWSLFVYITWLFFKKTSKRLTEIQAHMEENKNKLTPSKMIVEKKDEIGALKESFNLMVDDLNESHKKEEKEKKIRKQLIASLSHDLRTPLSIINGHVHKLRELPLDKEVEESLFVITKKVTFLSELIDNLSSYTVLSEGRLPLTMEKKEVIPIIRTSLIDWYPLFEDMGFEIDIDLSHSFIWEIDEIWLLRILNNLFQNIKRHAYQGKYINVKTGRQDNIEYITIVDRGPGMEELSNNKGKGIGLSIVHMMVEQMNLSLDITSHYDGTQVTIYKHT